MSEVWNHFGMAENRQRVTCRHCGKIMKRSDSSTKNMWGHLLSFHRSTVGENCFFLKRKRRHPKKMSNSANSHGTPLTASLPNVTKHTTGDKNQLISGGLAQQREVQPANSTKPSGTTVDDANDGGSHELSSLLLGMVPLIGGDSPAVAPNLPNPYLGGMCPLLPTPSYLVSEALSRFAAHIGGICAATTVARGCSQPLDAVPKGMRAKEDEPMVIEDPIPSKRICDTFITNSPVWENSTTCDLREAIHRVACRMGMEYTVDCTSESTTFRIHAKPSLKDVGHGACFSSTSSAPTTSIELRETDSEIICRGCGPKFPSERWAKNGRALEQLIMARCRSMFLQGQ